MPSESVSTISGYSKYNPEAQRRKKINPLAEIYPHLPQEKYDVIFPFTDFLEFKTSLKKYNYNTKEPLYCNPTYQLVTVEKVFDNYEKAKELAESKNHQLILSLNLLSLKDSKESQNLESEKGLLSHNLSIGQYFEQIISQNTVNMSLYNYHEGQSLVRCVKNDSME